MSNCELKPARVFEQFAEINKIPRPSKHEEQMIEYLKEFGRKRNLETEIDETGNVIIRKPATKGHENAPMISLQSHMDMVCDKLVDVDIDFFKDPIQTYIDGEWLRAKGTTLGADDGIGCAIELAVLDSDDIEHGPIECVFTRDEETSLGGALGMKPGFMKGDMLINLDSEDEGQIFISCAGGKTTSVKFTFEREQAPEGYFFMKASIKGLKGGHSGDDINKKRANANKLLVRFLCQVMEQTDLRLIDIQSGGLHNAIPREGMAVCAVPFKDKEEVRLWLNLYQAFVEDEYSVTEKQINFTLESVPSAPYAMESEAMKRMLLSLQAVHNGVFAMSQDMEGLVETSSNLASIHKVTEGVEVTTSQRSSVASARENMSLTVRAAFELGGATVVTNEGYPGWKLNPNSEIVQIARDSYVRLFGKEPLVLAIHAGLECGLFSEKYPHLDMVSMGPTLRGVHSPDERLLIPTVKMVWDHLLDMLKHVG